MTIPPRLASRMSTLLRLLRPSVSLFAALSTAAGALLHFRGEVGPALVASSAVFLLAAGASGLNQYQERELDAMMERTRHRPLPSGSMTPARALIISCALLASGLVLLIPAGGSSAVLLGVAAIVWYNGVYTFLKRKTAFAAVPGALVGALPPAIGWIAAGGSLFDGQLVLLCLFFYLWQIPHFWLLVLRYGEQYEAAGLPSLRRVFREGQLARLTLVWTVAAAASALLLPLAGLVRSPALSLPLGAVVLLIIMSGIGSYIRRVLPGAQSKAFRRINGFVLIVTLILALDGILRHYHVLQRIP
ncbi:MAG TPA: protoheme IX farnesyltransferase [Nitrospiraceae bacterium]|nr:protoheme IX farnesyltransferase [Nitrospiraceae bacterium]